MTLKLTYGGFNYVGDVSTSYDFIAWTAGAAAGVG